MFTLLLTSVLLGGCSTSVHFKDKKGICLGLCVYSETEATQEVTKEAIGSSK